MTERQSARMSKIKNGGLDQHGTEPCEQQQFRTAGVKGVKLYRVANLFGKMCTVFYQNRVGFAEDMTKHMGVCLVNVVVTYKSFTIAQPTRL